MIQLQQSIYHNVEVEDVEITHKAMSWLVPHKEDSSVIVNTCQSEILRGRRSSPSKSRGEPDTCRSLYINGVYIQ